MNVGRLAHRGFNGDRIATDNGPLERLPECMRKKIRSQCQSASGRLAMSDAIDPPVFLDPTDPIPMTMVDDFPNWQNNRNNSILAHGFRPLGENDWKRARTWILQWREDLWQERLWRQSSDQLPDQLPNFSMSLPSA